MDVVLSLYPWMIVRNLQLQNRERLGVAIAMGLGAMYVFSQTDSYIRTSLLKKAGLVPVL
jgi:hypothetical protein